MKLFVLGATGKTGGEILRLALQRGHQVTAFVRSPQKLTPHPSLHVVQGDPKDPDALAAALPGHAAVLSAIGPRFKDAMRPSTLLADCAASTVDAMGRAGVPRLAIVSAAVLFPEKGLYFAFFRWFLNHHIRDLRAMEDAVRTSQAEWTIARPPQLKDSPEMDCRILRDGVPPGGRSASFCSVAAFLLDSVERSEHSREIVGLAR